MKTTRTKKISSEPGLQSRPEQSSTGLSNSQIQTAEIKTASRLERPVSKPIDFVRRRVNRALPTESVLQLLQKEAPGFFNLCEVVGKWVWIQFREKQPRNVTALLAELGFHWNNKRQAWQHPCGTIVERADYDPRQRYQSYFPADMKAA